MASTETTSRSAELYQRACRSLATGVSSSLRRFVTETPLYIDHADGAHFYDVDGNCRADYTLGWGPLIVGSNHAGINAAVAKQLTKGYTYGCQHVAEIELAELIVESVPGVEQVIFSNTGTEAIQSAIRIARAHTGRDKILKFEGHYHGWLNNVLVSYRPKSEDTTLAQPTCGGQPASEYADTLVLPWNDIDALKDLFALRGDEIACVLTEPILANSGSCMPKPGYLEALVELCREHGAVSIFDEVITGFRIALGGAREYFGVEPDLSVYGKALAGGFTMSAVGGRAEMFEVLRDQRTIHSGTYNGTTFNIIAAIETIRELRKPGTYERMNAHGQAIAEALTSAAADVGLDVVVSGVGSVFSVHFGVKQAPRDYRDTTRSDMQTYTRFRAAMLDNGVQLLPDARWYIGTQHDEAVLEHVINAIESSMKDTVRCS
ncbi:aspartate aminotransferase family protein [Blastopirellula marina]|uniref:Glutamate-1-semialdehyde 2,1-aminomutase n=1 Tax=Blastopirellula marina DSM 3645 TaxID=314230 RepID=A3ZYZ2_9BACT|nr:aspartate aminotransferase family protein [Blastopirellula marina]EAQ78357.1 glutamate-1-semialdehyde 2,1-aminomutase [Blastopirellula marina DSM 3645]